jgi:hypothetical protein
MKDKLILYNHFHNGDIFFSRPIIKLLKNHFNIDYYHNQNTPLFLDIPEINEYKGIPQNLRYTDHFINTIKNGIINTWIGKPGYINRINSGCYFENHMELTKEICDYFNIQITNYDDCLPEVNFENLPNCKLIEKIMLDYKQKFKKIVLISNGDVNSGQSSNFDFFPIINNLSTLNSDILFIVTKPVNEINKNIVNIERITNTYPDLLYISQISTYCDVIVGRASGPYCFTQLKNNLLDNNKTYISFNNDINEGRFYSNLKSKFVWSDNYEQENIIKTIKNNLF